MVSYYDAQAQKLAAVEIYAVKIRAAGGGGETHWMNINPGQLGQIMDILKQAHLKQADRYYEIAPDDVGKAHIRAFGKTWPVDGFIGRILPSDVGKRVYKVRNDAGDSEFLQVENNEQRDRRLNR